MKLKKNMRIVMFVALAVATGYAKAQTVNRDAVLKDVAQQTELMLRSIPSARNGKTELVSPRTVEEGKLKLVSSRDWTSGFFAGELWYLANMTGDARWQSIADSMTRLLEREKLNAGTHDMGFKIYCSYGNAYRVTRNTYYKDVIIQAAKTLSTRFNKKIGAIRSWDHHQEVWQFPVIIDNMMNLELLFAATRFTGDSSFYKIAITHANTTLKNHFRPDYSSYHVIGYDTITGKVLTKGTHQGYADNSSWARGQAWALYGYTMCYRETGDKRYLRQAENIANFIFNNRKLPADYIPYWDFNDPGIPNAPRDASAAAVMASALYELTMYSGNWEKYRRFADKITTNLTNAYRAPVNTNSGFILLHSTGNKPANSEIDTPINYADYYYLEAVYRSAVFIRKNKVQSSLTELLKKFY